MHTILSLVAAGMGVAFVPEGRVRCGWTVWDGATDGNAGRPHRGSRNRMEATRRSPGAGRVPADGQIPAAELASRCPGKFREERPRWALLKTP